MSKRLEEIKKRNDPKNCDLTQASTDIDWLIRRVEKLESYIRNFGDAERLEVFIHRKDGLSVLNFHPKDIIPEEDENGDG